VNPRPGTLPARPGGRPGAGDIGRFLGSHHPGTLPARPGHRPGYGGIHRGEISNSFNRAYVSHPIYGRPFGRGWYGRWNWGYNRWPYWGLAATGAVLGNWLGWGYGGYGSSEPLSYYPVEEAPVEAYEEQVTAPMQVAEAGEAAPVAADAELLNLGNFGIVPFGQKDLAYSLQLATTKEGIVRGLQYDIKADTAVEVKGSIEKSTLRIAWQGPNTDDPYFETNVDQLTQEESYVNVYNPKTKSLTSWQMLQIDEKDLPK